MKRNYFYLSLVFLFGVLAVAPTFAQETVDLQLWRFFNACFEEWEGVTEITDDTDDVCAVNQVLAQVWNAENPDIQVETTVTSWPGTTELNAALAAGTPPDLMSMHAKRVSLYASRGALTPLSAYLEEAGIDLSDILPSVLDSVSYEGEIYALPFDVHGILWHINLDFWDQAGLLDSDGNPMIPANLEEFRVACAKMLEVTDRPILDNNYENVGSAWWWYAILHQLGGTAIDEEGLPTINSEESVAALNLMLELKDEGCMSMTEVQAEVQEAFFAGESPGTVDGTWMVNEYEATTHQPDAVLTNYYVAPLPMIGDQPASWGGSHVWVVPLGLDADPTRVQAIAKYLKWIYDNQIIWARTGHGVVSSTVLESEEYQALPHRGEYADFPGQVVVHPGADWVNAFDSVMVEELQAVVAGIKSAQQGLDDAQARLMDLALFGG